MLAIVQKISDNLKSSQEVAFNLDKETIDKIGAIVLEIVEMFKNCKKTPEQAVSKSNVPGRAEKVGLRRAVRKQLGFFKNMREGDDYYDAVLKAGYTVTVGEMQEAYNKAA